MKSQHIGDVQWNSEGTISLISPVKGDYIKTYTGKRFVPKEPDVDKIDIRDIAHALSLICRGNGHVKTFFSVAQHCIFCAREAEARGYSNKMILACLLHDAAECYLSDIPRPIKKHMMDYCELENQILDLAYQKLIGQPMQEDEQKLVKEIDDAFLYFDLEVLLNEYQDGPVPKLLCPPSYEGRPFADVEEEFLEIYYQYTDGSKHAPIYLENIAEAFDSGFGDWEQFLNMETGEIVSLPDSDNIYIDRTEEDEELLEEIEEADKYVRLWDQRELREKDMMWDFARMQDDEKVANKLINALRGRHPYRYFKDATFQMGVRDEYFRFRHEQYLERAKEWCEVNEIRYRRKR